MLTIFAATSQCATCFSEIKLNDDVICVNVNRKITLTIHHSSVVGEAHGRTRWTDGSCVGDRAYQMKITRSNDLVTPSVNSHVITTGLPIVHGIARISRITPRLRAVEYLALWNARIRRSDCRGSATCYTQNSSYDICRLKINI